MQLPREVLFPPQHYEDLAYQAPGQEPSRDHPPSSPKRPMGTSEGDAPLVYFGLSQTGAR